MQASPAGQARTDRRLSCLLACALFLFASVAQSGSAVGAQHHAYACRGQAVPAQSTANAPFPNPGPFKLVTKRSVNGSRIEYWQARGETGDFGGSLTTSTFGSDPKTFNFWAADDAVSAGISMLMFEPLVGLDVWTGKPYPRLANSIHASADGQTYTIKLRQGLKWSDGQPITADDVVFTFNTIIGKGFGSSSYRDILTTYGKFPTVEKIDNLTVRFHTAAPFAPFLHNLQTILIAPKHVMEPVCKRPREEFYRFWDINCDPKTLVVSGMFKVSRYVPAQRIELTRNVNYGMVDKLGRTLPYLDKFVESIVPDQNTQILKFYGGDIDFLDIGAVRGLDAALMKQREATGDFTMYNLGPDGATTFLMFNMNRRKDPKTGKYFVDPVKQKWFNDVNFRQAVNHVVDRKRIVSNVLRGVGLPLYTAESPAALYFNKDLKTYDQDFDLANKLLKKSGFQRRGNKLFDKAGHQVEFTLNTNSGNANRDASCVMIVNDLKKLGMKVDFQPIDFNIMIDKTSNSMQWEAIVMSLTTDTIEPYNDASIWKSDGRLHEFDQRLPNAKGLVVVNDARDWEKEIDGLLDSGAATLDERKRRALYYRYQKIAYDRQPFIFLFCPLKITAIRKTFGNYKPMPLMAFYTPVGTLHNLEEIYIRKPKRKP